MKTLWSIAKKDLLQIVRDKGALFSMLIVPFVLIAIVGLAFGSLFSGNGGPIAITVAVSNQDSGYFGKSVVDALNINNKQLKVTVKYYHDATQVSQQVQNNHADAGIAIAAGTTEKLQANATKGVPTQNLVQFYSLPTNNQQSLATIAQQIVNGVVKQRVAAQYTGSAATKQVYSICQQPGNHCAQNTINPVNIARTVGSASAMTAQTPQVETLTAGRSPQTNTFDQIVPGYAIFFALFGIAGVAGTILQEKEDGTFRRLLIAPIQKYALLGGKLVAQFVKIFVQLLILIGIGYLVFHLHVGSWPALLLLLLGASFAATGLGIVLVAIIKTRRQLDPIVTIIVLVTSAIGGAWWPLWLEPSWLQNFAKLGITAWAMEGLNGVMMQGKGVMEVLPNILALLAYGVICFLIALRFFRFQEKTVA